MLLAVLALLAADAPAPMPLPKEAPGKPDAAAVRAGTYTVEPEHTQVRFGVLHMGFNPYFGTFSKVSGTLTLDPAHAERTGLTIEVPIASVQTPSDKLDGELKSKQFFDANAYPTMRFTSTSVIFSGTRATIVGTLTMHGVSKPITLQAVFVGTGDFMGKTMAGFTALGVLKRSDFGLGYGIPLVSDAVTMDISVAFQKQPG